MICDICHKKVDPPNNALLYDAALFALSNGAAVPEQTRRPIEGLLDLGDAFYQGEIVPGDPLRSIRNVLETHIIGRHLYATDTCEGSPSRRRAIEEGTQDNGEPIGELAKIAQQAYELIRALETPPPAQR